MNIIRTIFFSSIIFILHDTVNAQHNYRNQTFQSGEFVSYKVYYKLGFLWFNAAEASFLIKKENLKNRPVFHFESKGFTRPNYDWIFKVRDFYGSYADTLTLKPFYFSRVTSEGSYRVNNQYIFDHYRKKIYSSIENSDTPKHKDTLALKPGTLDVLTAIYACRTIDVEGLMLNDTIPLDMVIDNEIYDLYLRFLGREQVETNTGEKYRCLKFTILMVEGSIFKGGEDIQVWISDDKAKIPIKVQAEILVGSIIAYVDTVKDNMWPLSSKINDQPNKE